MNIYVLRKILKEPINQQLINWSIAGIYLKNDKINRINNLIILQKIGNSNFVI